MVVSLTKAQNEAPWFPQANVVMLTAAIGRCHSYELFGAQIVEFLRGEEVWYRKTLLSSVRNTVENAFLAHGH